MDRRIKQCASFLAVLGGLGAIGAGCLDRPVVTAQPLTKTNFSTVVAQNAVSQVDILFDIDNSASMGDKQTLLELAVPDLVNRLLNPNCLAADGVTVLGPSVGGNCAMIPNSTAEFTPVHDMHLGIVSSSLGTRGGDICPAAQMTNAGAAFLDGTPALPSHTDDMGHLLSRTAPAVAPLSTGTYPTNEETEAPSPVVGAQNFIDWFPAGGAGATVGVQALAPATPIMDPMTLEADFANLVTGVHAFGCGIESQLESWYRFLIQPDPYESIGATSGTAAWEGYDLVIIQQRHDFLRPKSLVAVIVLTDENDSEIDARSFGGQGYEFMVDIFHPPFATSVCAATTGLGPDSPQCTSCAYCQTPGTFPCTDANCMMNPDSYQSPVDWGYDPNLRHVHMKYKYGIVPQYPIQRYYLGLTSQLVPDRTTEYPAGASFYEGGTTGDSTQLHCTNPLFAPAAADGSTTLPNPSLPTFPTDAAAVAAALCNTANPPSQARSRPSADIFFAHIGGVPHQLLQATPGETDASGNVICATGTLPADCPQKDILAPADWIKILGKTAGSATYTTPRATRLPLTRGSILI